MRIDEIIPVIEAYEDAPDQTQEQSNALNHTLEVLYKCREIGIDDTDILNLMQKSKGD